jgi:hypothetical protein
VHCTDVRLRLGTPERTLPRDDSFFDIHEFHVE